VLDEEDGGVRVGFWGFMVGERKRKKRVM